MSNRIKVTLPHRKWGRLLPFTYETTRRADDGYFDQDEDVLELLDAFELLEDPELKWIKGMYLACSQESPKGRPASEICYQNKGETDYGVKVLRQLRGPLDVLDALGRARTKRVEFVCDRWKTHHAIRETFQHLIKYNERFVGFDDNGQAMYEGENWNVDVSFLYDPPNRDIDCPLYVDPEDPFCTEDVKSECSMVWPEYGGRWLVSGSVDSWYHNVEVPPAPFIWKFEDMTESEKEEVMESEDHVWAGGEGVWNNWGCTDVKASEIVIVAQPSED